MGYNRFNSKEGAKVLLKRMDNIMTTQGQTTNTAETTETTTPAKKQGQAKQGQQAPAGQKKPKEEKTPKAPREKKEKVERATPAHMPKIDKVAQTLPPMSNDVQTLFSAAVNMSTADIVSLSAHLQIAVRRRGVQQAAALIQQGKDNPSRELKVGQRVRVVTSSTNPRLIGLQGTVTKVQRIRCYVELDGKTYSEKEDAKGNKYKGDYFFTSDVTAMSAAPQDLSENLAATVLRLTSSAAPTSIDDLMDGEVEEPVSATG